MEINQRLVIAAALTCLANTTAQAVHVSQNGTGQVLLYPYYNVNEGNITFVSVTNTTDLVKAVKVRFREAVGGESVFDFTLYLSPRDVWVGALSQQSGAVRLSIPADSSCTVPGTAELEAASFSSARIDPAYDPNRDDTQSAAEVLARLSEGHIEVIEMAELPYTTLGTDIATAVSQERRAIPIQRSDCSVPVTFNASSGLGAILDAGIVTASGVSQDFANPGGGLFGEAAIFNANSGIYFPYNATALKQFAEGPIWWPQNDQPFTAVEGVAGGLDSAGYPVANYRTADSGSLLPALTPNADLPDLSTPTTAEVSADMSTYHVISNHAVTSTPVINTGSFAGAVTAGNRARDDKASAVSAALTGHAVMIPHITSGDYSTDWVITFPTRYTKVSDSIDDQYRAPFTSIESPDSGSACHIVDISLWNREGDIRPVFDFGISPVVPPRLCYEVNVLDINGSAEFSDSISSNAVKTDELLGDDFLDGWAIIDLSDYSATPVAGSDPAVVTGLPVLGFSALADTVSGTERGGVFSSRIVVDEQ